MNLLKRCLLPVLTAALLILCSCAPSPPDVIESLISNNDTAYPKAADPGRYKDYRELFTLYKECNDSYFNATEAAINTIIGQKYMYGLTAYKHSDELAEIAEMFFDDNAENTLNIYFALRGFEDKEYAEDENKAEYSCKKKDDEYKYNASYDVQNKSFEITLHVNGELKDSCRCAITDDSLTKYCYSGPLDRTFISVVNKDSTSRIDWYEGLTGDGADVPEEEHGYIIFDGSVLSGVIK